MSVAGLGTGGHVRSNSTCGRGDTCPTLTGGTGLGGPLPPLASLRPPPESRACPEGTVFALTLACLM